MLLEIILVRLAIKMILEGSYGELISFFAPVCSSFSAANQGTAARSLLNGFGMSFHPSIRRGNKMMTRTGCIAFSTRTSHTAAKPI